MKLKMFYLGNDRSTAKVRFIPYPDVKSSRVAIHYPVGVSQSPIKCKGEDCEYCRAKGFPTPIYKYFFALYDEADKCIKFWERSNRSADAIIGELQKYPKDTVFSITRYGEKFDLSSKYVLTPISNSPVPEIAKQPLPTASEIFDTIYLHD